MHELKARGSGANASSNAEEFDGFFWLNKPDSMVRLGMLRMLLRLLLALPGFLLGAVMFAAGTTPDSAASNLAVWAKSVGIASIPSWLVLRAADWWAFGAAAGLLIVYVGLLSYISFIAQRQTVR